MSKSKKNNRSKKSKKQNRKSRKHLINHLKKENAIKINNTGLTEVIYKEGKQSPKKTVFEWNGNYDGKNAKIHMDLDVDGSKTKTDLKLSNQDLMNILKSTGAVNQPLDQRLQKLDTDLSMMYPSTPIIIHSGEMPMPMPMPMSLENEIFASPMLSEPEIPMQLNSETQTPMSMSNSAVKKMKNASKSRRKNNK